MKLLKKHYEYLPYIYFPILIIALVLLYFFPQQVLLCFRAHWLVLIFLLLLFITPIGNLRLGNDKSLNFWLWLLLILSGEIGIGLIYWGFLQVIGYSLPILVTATTNISLNTIKTLLITWGIYPFAAFLLMGIIFAYFGFYKRQPATLSLALQPILKNKAGDPLSLSADFIVRNVSLFMLASAIGIVILQLLIIFANALQIPINSGLNLNTLTIATIILVLINYPTWEQKVRYLSTRKIPLIAIAILYSMFMLILLLILNYGLNVIATNYPPLTNPVFQFKSNNWFNYWLILSALWWSGWIPLMGGLIAFISKGYKIRTVVLGGILTLLITSSFFGFLAQQKPEYISYFNQIASVIGILLIMPLFMRAKYTIYQMRAVVPQTQPQKFRSLHFYTQALLKNAAFILILYLPMGIYALNILIFVLIFPLAIAIIAAFAAFGIVALREF